MIYALMIQYGVGYRALARLLMTTGSKDVASLLTATSWCTDQVRYTFHVNKAYEWASFSDPAGGAVRGYWDTQPISAGQALLLLDGHDVFYTTLNGAALQLGPLGLRACASTSLNTGPLIDLPADPEPFLVYTQLTAHPWIKSGAADAADPLARIHFKRDGSYEAGSLDGSCTFRGTWSLHGMTITRDALGEHCDMRTVWVDGYTSSEVDLADSMLMLQGVLYEDERQAVDRPGTVVVRQR
jgi:hypothetical protein